MKEVEMGNELNKQSTVTSPKVSAIQQDDNEINQLQHMHKSVDLTSPLTESQHDPNDLARELSRILRKRESSLTTDQRTLLKAYQSGEPIYNIYADPKVPEEAKIHAYSTLFNILIFQGQLTKRVTIELNPRLSEQWDGETSVENRYAMITLWSQDYICDPSVRLQRYLGILLQELMNAYLAIYGCMQCRRNPMWQGEVGHGEAWKDMMAAIQEVVEDHSFLDLDLKLGGLGAPAEGSRPGGTSPPDASSQ